MRPLVGVLGAGVLAIAVLPAATATAATPRAIPTQRIVTPTYGSVSATVYFAVGDDWLGVTARRTLTTMVKSMPAGWRVLSAKVTGYVQLSPSHHNDFSLGMDRARAVKAYLAALHVPGATTSAGGVAGAGSHSRRAVVTVTYIVPAPQVVYFPAPSSMVVGGPHQALYANSNAGLPVTITSTTKSVCRITGHAGAYSVYTVAVGTCTLVASQAGTATIGRASNVTRSFHITLTPYTVTVRTYHPVDTTADLYYCGRWDGNCTTANVTHLSIPAGPSERDITVYRNTAASSSPLDGHEVRLDAWVCTATSGGAHITPAPTPDPTQYCALSPQMIQVLYDVNGDGTIGSVT